MEGKTVFYSLFLHLLSILTDTRGFNLDTNAPIIKEEVRDSYFGFSVAQHVKTNWGTGQLEYPFLVGAPLANVSRMEAHPEIRRLVRPGVVFACPVSSLRNDCEELLIDDERPLSKENKNGQWLGVTVSSQAKQDEGKAVACAHRYMEQGWGLGICVGLSNSLDREEYIEPCAYKSTNKGHEEYGVCQAGISSGLSEDGDVVVGAPGPFNWRGALFKNIVFDSLTATKTWYMSRAEPPINEGDPKPATSSNSYLGMSATIGRINMKGHTKTYISGAPRSKENGQVLLFHQGNDSLEVERADYLTGDQFGSGFGYSVIAVDVNRDGLEDIVVGAPFYGGEQRGGAIYVYMNSEEGGISAATVPVKITSRDMAPDECRRLDCENARFGFSLTKLGDVDQDNYEDIAVGAPYEGDGCVYVFRGSAKGLELKPSQRIAASSLLSARPIFTFGYSLSGGVDMDGNGYPDLVVGAYDSAKTLVLRSRPVIHIHSNMQAVPDKINPKVTQCSKDGLNNNCFSLRVCLRFNAEPKDEFSGKLPIVYKLEAELFNNAKISRVYFKGANPETKHMIERTVKLFEQRNFNFRCMDHLIYLIKNNKDFLNPIMFRLSYGLPEKQPPRMRPGDALPDLMEHPVLNEATSQVVFPVEFVKNCGGDDICTSSLGVTADFYSLDQDELGKRVFKVGQVDTLVLEVTVQNSKEDAHETTLTVALPPEVSYIGTGDGYVSVGNDPRVSRKISCRPSEENRVICAIGNPMVKDQITKFNIRLDPSNLSPAIDSLIFKVRVNTTSEEMDEEDDTAIIEVLVVVETDIQIEGFSKPEELFYGGKVRGESAIKYEEEIGGEVVHIYEVKNTGTGRVSKSTVTIQWPYEVHDPKWQKGKHLLYVMEMPVASDGQCYIANSPKYVNPINVKLDRLRSIKFQAQSSQSSAARARPVIEAPVQAVREEAAAAGGGKDKKARREGKSRTRRETREVTDPVSGKTLTIVELSCDKGSAKCFDIVCNISELRPDQSVAIQIRSRLWNSTFLEDYRNVDQVLIYSSGRVELDPTINIKQTSTSNDRARALTKAIPDLEVKDVESVPMWVIIVAAIGGVLLLIILILLLWKCGFFKRNVPDDMRQHKAKKEKARYNEDGYN